MTSTYYYLLPPTTTYYYLLPTTYYLLPTTTHPPTHQTTHPPSHLLQVKPSFPQPSKVEASRGLLGVMSEFSPWSPDTGKDADVGAYGPWTGLMKESSSPSAAVPSRRPQARKACEFGPWSNLKELGQPQTQSPKRRRVDTVDLSNACVVDVPACVRTEPPQTKAAQNASDKEAIKARWSGPGRCVCAAHKSKKPKGPACHRALPLAALLRTCLAVAAMSSEEKGLHLPSHARAEFRSVEESRCRGW